MMYCSAMPPTSVAHVRQLLELAREFNLKSLSVASVSFEFKETFHVKPTQSATQQGDIPIYGEQMPSDDEMLYMSADSPIQVDKQ